ncbi:hypothetical protein [Candidatus Hodarchaeum mangrovi]
MPLRKIRQKKPTDSIREKVPSEGSIPKNSIKVKTPDETDFKLPPPRAQERNSIPKSQITPPSDFGSQKIRLKDSNPVNNPPPIDDRNLNNNHSQKPSSHGFIHQRDKTSGINPPENVHEDLFRPPSKHGVINDKKQLRSINQPLQRQIREKTPGKEVRQPPPTHSPLKEKTPDQIVNKSPPKIIQKHPKDKIPPPTVPEKIPKMKIKNKEPK